jgi:hypothetical protein
MSPVLSGRRSSPALRLLILCLSTAIAAWSSQARLSLYSAQKLSHPVRAARLLQDGEINKKSCALLSRRFSRASQSFTGSVVVPPQPRFVVRRSALIHKLPPGAIRFYPDQLRFRPPPSIV